MEIHRAALYSNYQWPMLMPLFEYAAEHQDMLKYDGLGMSFEPDSTPYLCKSVADIFDRFRYKTKLQFENLVLPEALDNAIECGISYWQRGGESGAGEGISRVEKITWLNLTGVLIEACAIILLFTNGKDQVPDKAAERKRLLTALGAFLMLGFSQLFYIYPSLPQNASLKLPASASSFFSLFTNMLCFLVIMLSGKKDLPVPWRIQIPFSLAWGTIAAAFFILFLTFRLMGERGQAGLVYPIASSTEILLFTLFTRVRLKERLSSRQTVALTLIIIGIFMIKL